MIEEEMDTSPSAVLENERKPPTSSASVIPGFDSVVEEEEPETKVELEPGTGEETMQVDHEPQVEPNDDQAEEQVKQEPVEEDVAIEVMEIEIPIDSSATTTTSQSFDILNDQPIPVSGDEESAMATLNSPVHDETSSDAVATTTSSPPKRAGIVIKMKKLVPEQTEEQHETQSNTESLSHSTDNTEPKNEEMKDNDQKEVGTDADADVSSAPVDVNIGDEQPALSPSASSKSEDEPIDSSIIVKEESMEKETEKVSTPIQDSHASPKQEVLDEDDASTSHVNTDDNYYSRGQETSSLCSIM